LIRAQHATPLYQLDDLAARFIINLPTQELESGPERICFQIEQAHWFYVDFLQPKNPKLVRQHNGQRRNSLHVSVLSFFVF
jgi:hypothetical protein